MDWGAGPQYPQQFVGAPHTSDFNNPPSTSMDLSGMPAHDPRAPHMRMDSVDSTSGFDFDPGIIDTSDVNWQNWDELVRQFGMDVDTTFDRRPGDMDLDAGCTNGGWNMAPPGGGNNPVQANLRMGMGMGGGDWF